MYDSKQFFFFAGIQQVSIRGCDGAEDVGAGQNTVHPDTLHTLVILLL